MMRPKAAVKIVLGKRAKNATSEAASTDREGDGGGSINLVVDHADATVGYARRKIVGHLGLDAADFTVRLQLQEGGDDLWEDDLQLTYPTDPRELIATPVSLLDSIIPRSYFQRESDLSAGGQRKVSKACVIA